MASLRVRAFRGLRFVPSRVELASVIAWGPASGDPRHVGRLLDDHQGDGDGKDAPVRRARLRLADWQRAGVMKRDEQPAMYAVRRRDDDGESAIGLFCAVSVEGGVDVSVERSAVESAVDPARARQLEGLGVSIEPVVAGFDEARVKRTLENAVDREADATWKIGSTSFELWCLDEESTTARIATLLSQAPITLGKNAAALAAHAAWWQRASGGASDDDRPRAGAFALAFLHPIDEPWSDVPVGAALAPLMGTLEK